MAAPYITVYFPSGWLAKLECAQKSVPAYAQRLRWKDDSRRIRLHCAIWRKRKVVEKCQS